MRRNKERLPKKEWKEQKEKLEKKYVFARWACTCHDRDCRLLKYMPEEGKEYIDEIPERVILCRKCRRRILLRMAIGNDQRNIGRYEHFLERAGIDDLQLDELVQKNGALFHLDDLDTLCVRCNEDRWQIVLNRYAIKELKHNNYILTCDGNRHILEGYHVQQSGNLRSEDVVRNIIYYRYSKHSHGVNS